jgi:hypothetical protein
MVESIGQALWKDAEKNDMKDFVREQGKFLEEQVISNIYRYQLQKDIDVEQLLSETSSALVSLKDSSNYYGVDASTLAFTYYQEWKKITATVRGFSPHDKRLRDICNHFLQNVDGNDLTFAKLVESHLTAR